MVRTWKKEVCGRRREENTLWHPAACIERWLFMGLTTVFIAARIEREGHTFEVSRVRDDDGASSLQLIELVGHIYYTHSISSIVHANQ